MPTPLPIPPRSMQPTLPQPPRSPRGPLPPVPVPPPVPPKPTTTNTSTRTSTANTATTTNTTNTTTATNTKPPIRNPLHEDEHGNPLPPGWERRTQTFYVDHNSRRTTWHRPALPTYLTVTKESESCPAPVETSHLSMGALDCDVDSLSLSYVSVSQPTMEGASTTGIRSVSIPHEIHDDSEEEEEEHTLDGTCGFDKTEELNHQLQEKVEFTERRKWMVVKNVVCARWSSLINGKPGWLKTKEGSPSR